MPCRPNDSCVTLPVILRLFRGLVESALYRRLPLAAVLLLSLLLPGCRKKQPPPPPPPKVTVAQPVQKTVTDSLELNGTTRAVRTVQLVARVPGYLQKVLFRDGQLVKAGQPLFVIEQDTTAAQLVQAEAQIIQQKATYTYAEKQLIRYTNMLRQNAAAQSDVDNWQFQRDSSLANVRNAEAARDLAKLNLTYTQVKAPFAGRIDRHLRDRGNLVGAGENTVLAEMSQVDPMYVYFTISDLDLGRLMKSAGGIPGQSGRPGWSMTAALPGEEGYPHKGRLDFAASTLSDSTGTLLLRGVIPNASGRILPGLQARIKVPLQQRRALLVPETALSSDQQGEYLLVVNAQNAVERRPVKSGFTVQHMRVIDQGLQGGEWVVVDGLLRAIPGKKVTPERQGTGAATGHGNSAPPSQPPPSGGRSGGPAAGSSATAGPSSGPTVPAPGGGGSGRGTAAGHGNSAPPRGRSGGVRP